MGSQSHAQCNLSYVSLVGYGVVLHSILAFLKCEFTLKMKYQKNKKQFPWLALGENTFLSAHSVVTRGFYAIMIGPHNQKSIYIALIENLFTVIGLGTLMDGTTAYLMSFGVHHTLGQSIGDLVVGLGFAGIGCLDHGLHFIAEGLGGSYHLHHIGTQLSCSKIVFLKF